VLSSTGFDALSDGQLLTEVQVVLPSCGVSLSGRREDGCPEQNSGNQNAPHTLANPHVVQSFEPEDHLAAKHTGAFMAPSTSIHQSPSGTDEMTSRDAQSDGNRPENRPPISRFQPFFSAFSRAVDRIPGRIGRPVFVPLGEGSTSGSLRVRTGAGHGLHPPRASSPQRCAAGPQGKPPVSVRERLNIALADLLREGCTLQTRGLGRRLPCVAGPRSPTHAGCRELGRRAPA